MTRFIVTVVCVGMLVSSCALFDSDDIEVGGVVSRDGLVLSLAWTPCMVEGSIQVEVEEHADRVVIDLDGDATNADCLGAARITLASELGNRVVIVGPDSQEFEYCGYERLCER
jgi:hypothetical protein